MDSHIQLSKFYVCFSPLILEGSLIHTQVMEAQVFIALK